jgi:8-oxo-dGTP pyrophosphatase MutT (NUDIX family)
VAVARRAARVLLIDDASRVLLFHAFDPHTPQDRYWFTAGGGLDEGETPAQGAVRELREETGLEIAEADVGEPVWHDVTTFPFEGTWYRQEQDFFVVRVPTFDVQVDGFDPAEARSIAAYRWWSLAELEATDEQVYPEQLPALLREILGA